MNLSIQKALVEALLFGTKGIPYGRLHEMRKLGFADFREVETSPNHYAAVYFLTESGIAEARAILKILA